MSISASLGNALTGLTASARAAQLVSNNVANAMTEGYGRREIVLSSRDLGGSGAGVKVAGIERVVDAGVVRDRRLADAGLALTDGRASYHEALGDILGKVDDPSSLIGRQSTLESTLIEAASRPDSTARLSAALAAAQDLAAGLNGASDRIQGLRLDADASIAHQVETLNASLKQVQTFNAAISRMNGEGRDVSALQDQRQQLIDGISRIVPVREVARDDGKVALYTSGGAILLDHTAREITFSPVSQIVPDMTLDSGALSGLAIDGKPVRIDGPYAPLGGGSLSAQFDIRDRLAPAAQADLDALARDLVTRFSDPTVDPSLAPGEAGLFTDRGAAFATADETGLSGRIAVNAAVDPDAGGALWRLRDGVGASVQGPSGDGTLFHALSDALGARRPVASGAASGMSHSFASLAAEMVSHAAADGAVADRDMSYAAARQSSLKALEQANGVDTDQEMQKLLLIEQSYAANARVVETINSLLELAAEDLMTAFMSIGNLARSLQMRTDNARLTADMHRLTSELSSGRKSQVGAGLSRDVGPLAAIERSLATLGSHALAISEAGLVAETTQDVLGRIDGEAEALSTSLLLVQGAGQARLVDAAGADARQRFDAMVGDLNTTVAGRSLFSGTAYDGPALQDGEAMLADLRAAVGAQTTADGVLAAVDAWFGPGGGFVTGGYLGATDPATPVRLGPDGSAQASVQANDPAVVATLRSAATAALLDLGVLSGAGDERAALARNAGTSIFEARAGLTELRGRLGTAQGRIEGAATRLASQSSALEIARNEITSADPYETATQLQSVQKQLETLYVLTGRLSELSLTNYLR